ncbi:MAG: hypothetical protein ACTSUD_03580 [Alphaproteobacteria bacterium]
MRIRGAFAALMVFAILGLVAGCNTIEGVGKDISATARGVNKALGGS